ncbi:MAG: hypothetical protein ACRC1H_19400 [Caldilineaceae bacterium]
MSDKSERVHTLVNTGPWPGMSEAFDAHMGAACWTDPAYAPDASTWAAAWKAGAAVAYAHGTAVVDKCNSYIVDNARLAEQVDNLRAALQWYADGLHFDKASPDAWDTVSGEPPNWWCDEAGTATVEDGAIAAMVLRGELTGAQVQALE